MKKIATIIILLLFLILLWYSHNVYQVCCGNTLVKDEIKKENTIPIVKKEVKENKDGSLLFEWNSDRAKENEYWSIKKAGILSNKVDGKILKILGPYYKEEGKELGIARAKVVYAKFSDQMDAKKVEFGATLIEYFEGAKTTPFSGTQYTWLVRNDNITEVDDKALIYFPTNSTKKLSNVNITNYLKDIAKSLKSNTKKVYLSGHSDNRGNAIKNKTLALGRANSIKNELIRLGIEPERIQIISYGEEKPIATNDTKIGRQKNRRVELQIK